MPGRLDKRLYDDGRVIIIPRSPGSVDSDRGPHWVEGVCGGGAGLGGVGPGPWSGDHVGRGADAALDMSGKEERKAF